MFRIPFCHVFLPFSRMTLSGLAVGGIYTTVSALLSMLSAAFKNDVLSFECQRGTLPLAGGFFPHPGRGVSDEIPLFFSSSTERFLRQILESFVRKLYLSDIRAAFGRLPVQVKFHSI